MNIKKQLREVKAQIDKLDKEITELCPIIYSLDDQELFDAGEELDLIKLKVKTIEEEIK